MDRFLAFLILLILLPVFLIVSVLVLISSPGSIFFKQKRIGKFGNPFTILKFRTMYVNASSPSTISIKGQTRITKIGGYLRKYKLDELPELMNIIRGEMTFVGPRPDVPGYADKLTGSDREMLKLKPGITGPASLKYIDEEDILSNINAPEIYNKEVIFPDKVKINLEYQKRKSFSHDIKIIWYTLIRKKWNEY